MAEDKIRHDDLIESDIFKNATQSAKEFEATLVNLETTLKRIATSAGGKLGGAPGTVGELKAQAKAIKDIDNAETALNEAQKQRVAVAEHLSQLRLKEMQERENLKRKFAEENRAEKEKLKAQKQSQDAYAKLSARHRELAREAKNLAVQYGVQSKQAKAATDAANKLGNQLKKIDASLGQHQRNVGNYRSMWAGLTNVLGTFGVTLGAGALISGLKDSVKAFVESEKNARALSFALKNVAGEGEIAFQTLIKQSEELQATGGVFSDDEIQKAQAQLVNYGLLSSEVEELMPKILDLATAQGVDLATATDTVIKGINGQTKGLKSVGLGFDDTGDKAQNYQIILDKLTKFEGAAADAATTTEGKYKVLMNRFDDLQEDIGEFLINTGSEYLTFWDQLTGKLSAHDVAMMRLKQSTVETLDPIIQKTLDQANAAANVFEKQAILAQKIAQLSSDIAALNAAATLGVKQGKDISGIQAQISAFEQQRERLRQELNTTKTEIQDMNKRLGDENAKETKKQADEYVYTWEDALAEVDAEAEKMQANEDKRHKDDLEREKKRIAMYKADQDERKRLEELYLAMQRKKNKEEHDEKMEQRRQELEELVEMEEIFSDAYFEGIAKRLDAKEKALQDESSMIDAELQRQSELLLAGQENTYSEMTRLKAENQAKMAQIEEQRRKQESAKEFAELFVEFTKAYAKDGDINAAAKAFAETIAVKSIANALAGNFAEGVENFKGKGTGTSDSNIIGFSNGESVVTAKGTQQTKGLVSAINERGYEGAADWAMNHVFKPQLAAALHADDGKNAPFKAPNWVQSAMLNELIDLKKTVKDKPEYGLKYNDAEKVFESVMRQKGITKVLKHKRF